MINLNQKSNHKDAKPDNDGIMKIIKFASVLIGIAIVIACYAYTRIENGMWQMLTYLIAAFVFSAAVFIIFVVIAGTRAGRHRGNFFLYDRKTKKELPVSALTFEHIRDRVLRLMAIFKYKGKLYIGDLFSDNINVPDQFKPLFCYEILYELATDDGMDAEAFLSFGNECADIFSRYLGQNGDHELAAKIRSYIFDFSSGNKGVEEFKGYMREQGEHIRSRMLKYTLDNINKFG